jgi:pyruvate dehydrogenase E1 component alpha subunit
VERKVVPWVAGDLGTSIGVATGAALALQRAGDGGVAVCAFGDGTANRGDAHENLNLAAVWKLPIVYVCQNNGWSISERVADYLPVPIVDRAAGYGIPGMEVDGQDVEAVRAAVRAGIERARAGAGPSLVEARTFRARGHWAGDTAQYQTDQERDAAWRDPLEVQAESVIAAGLATEADLARIREEADAEAAEALAAAKAAPDAEPADLGAGDVYA